jgi:hypothetical protein
MSGLDGLGWPNPEDEPKPKTMNDTPETDAEANNGSLCDQCVPVDFARKLERERDEARNENIRLKCTLAKWIEWSRMHGHLAHDAGIVADTREILSENAMGDTRRAEPGLQE